MRVVAWNVQQGGGSRIPRIVTALTALDPDVLVLSEYRASGPLAAAIAQHGWTHQIGLPDPAGGYASVLMASRRTLRLLGPHYPDETCSQRWVHAEVDGSGWAVAGALIPGTSSKHPQRKERFWDFVVSESHHGRRRGPRCSSAISTRDCMGSTRRAQRCGVPRTCPRYGAPAGSTCGMPCIRVSVHRRRGGNRARATGSDSTTRFSRRAVRQHWRSSTRVRSTVFRLHGAAPGSPLERSRCCPTTYPWWSISARFNVRLSVASATITGMGDARGIRFHFEMAAIIHARLADGDCEASTREKIAAFVRRMADLAKQGDPTFSYEWFYGACGLDPWGDLQPHFDTNVKPVVRWDPELEDFRRL